MSTTFQSIAVAATLALCACVSKPRPVTYYQDIQPLIAEKCGSCHVAGGIGPFPLQTSDDVIANKLLINADVSSRKMPPWQADDTCAQYSNDRSLTDAQISTITGWIAAGTPLGSPSDAPKTTPQKTGLSRVDYTMTPPASYTPQESPDDYRCYALPWPATTTQYVTGFNIAPGDQRIVHHVVAFIEPPDSAAQFLAANGADGMPGYPCFGGPGVATAVIPSLLGVWAPGSTGIEFPADTGIMMTPGSVIVMQIHYNTTSVPPAPDLSTLQVEVVDSVKRPAVILPYADPVWLTEANQLTIPAGSLDTMYEFHYDVSQALSAFSNDQLPDGLPFQIYMSGSHMHWLGTHVNTWIQHPNGDSTCLLEIPAWNFNWQNAYDLDTPVTFNPGDELHLECHFDNTQANQPVVNGVQRTAVNVSWGEDSADEMCMAFFYVTQ